MHFASIQAAPSFASSFPFMFGADKQQSSTIPCLIPCAIDQDPYFRLTRDVASQLRYAKPCLIHARFLDALQGPGSKMSASVESSAILLRDTPKQILNKINLYAFSGGQQSLEDHRTKGGDPEVDISYQYLKFFLEDDAELERIRSEYRAGTMTTGEIKAHCAEAVSEFCLDFQRRRADVTDAVLDHYMTPRPLTYRGALAKGPSGPGVDIHNVANPDSKNQAKKLEKQRLAQEKKEQKAREKLAHAGQ